MKLLCIDYGLNNLGFATAETPLATPYSTIHVNSLEDAVAKTLRIFNVVHPDRIVIGIPEGEIATAVHAFINSLRPLVAVDIMTHEETLSSQDAVGKLREAGASRTKLKNDHAFAACLILEDYLDMYPDLVKI